MNRQLRWAWLSIGAGLAVWAIAAFTVPVLMTDPVGSDGGRMWTQVLMGTGGFLVFFGAARRGHLLAKVAEKPRGPKRCPDCGEAIVREPDDGEWTCSVCGCTVTFTT